MSSEPLFSILLANYNNAKYLSDCLGSILKQTYTNYEIIVIDDCSTDDSVKIFKDFSATANKSIKIEINAINNGTGYTKARCVQLAAGSICGFLDSDDALLPTSIETMVQSHLEIPEASIIFSRRYICNNKLQIYDVSPDVTNTFISQIATPYINHFATFKKKDYDETSGIDTYMKRAVDQDLYLKLEEKGRVIFIPEILYLYRRNPNSISLNKNEYKAQAWHIYANSNACKRRGLSLDDYCSVLKPGKYITFMLKFLPVFHFIRYMIKKAFRAK